jgi:hypothetical protein
MSFPVQYPSPYKNPPIRYSGWNNGDVINGIQQLQMAASEIASAFESATKYRFSNPNHLSLETAMNKFSVTRNLPFNPANIRFRYNLGHWREKIPNGDMESSSITRNDSTNTSSIETGWDNESAAKAPADVPTIHTWDKS